MEEQRNIPEEDERLTKKEMKRGKDAVVKENKNHMGESKERRGEDGEQKA